MIAHLTSAEIDAFHGQRLDRERTEAIGAHVRECVECSRLLWSDDGIAQSVQSVWTSEAQSAVRRPRLAWAAAAAIALIAGAGVWLWASRDEPQQVRATPTRPLPPAATPRVIRDGDAAISLDANGNVQNISTPRDEWNTLVASALRTGTPPAADRGGLTGSGAILRGDDVLTSRVTLIEPVAVAVESDRPQFRWTMLAGARYRVVVARDGTAVIKGVLQSDVTWTASTPLARGETYAWQLTVLRDDGEITVPPPDAPPARFRVLSQGQLRELEAARASGSQLVTGLVAARLGVDDVAARELTAFATAHPELAAASRLAARYERPAPITTNADQ